MQWSSAKYGIHTWTFIRSSSGEFSTLTIIISRPFPLTQTFQFDNQPLTPCAEQLHNTPLPFVLVAAVNGVVNSLYWQADVHAQMRIDSMYIVYIWKYTHRKTLIIHVQNVMTWQVEEKVSRIDIYFILLLQNLRGKKIFRVFDSDRVSVCAELLSIVFNYLHTWNKCNLVGFIRINWCGNHQHIHWLTNARWARNTHTQRQINKSLEQKQKPIHNNKHKDIRLLKENICPVSQCTNMAYYHIGWGNISFFRPNLSDGIIIIAIVCGVWCVVCDGWFMWYIHFSSGGINQGNTWCLISAEEVGKDRLPSHAWQRELCSINC